MFRGNFEHTIDAKGRVSLPVRYREILSTQFDGRLVITHFDSCLLAFPYQEWLAFEDKLSSVSAVDEQVQLFKRYFIAGAYECSLDKLGRILIPPNLRKHAALEREVVFVGSVKQIEIWSKDRWEKVFSEAQEKFKETRNILATKFGL
jgi:MraZ protein